MLRIIGGIIIVALLAGLIAWWRLCPQCLPLPLPGPDPEPPPPPAHEFVIYEHPGAPVTGLRGINSAGVLVGYFQDTSDETSAHALLIRDGVMSTIDPPGSTRDRRAFGITDDETVALSFDGRNATLWADAEYTPVVYPGAIGTVVRGVNNRNDVGGEYTDAGEVVRAFVRIGGVFAPLSFPDAVRASVRGINDEGAAVGYTEAASGARRCFLLARDGTVTMLDYPDAASTMCGDINNRGDVVGAWADSERRLHGFVRRDGTFHSFDVTDAQDTLALGINDAGDIVGEATFGGRYGDYTIPHRGFFTSSFR